MKALDAVGVYAEVINVRRTRCQSLSFLEILMVDSIKQKMEIQCSIDKAFELFTNGFETWWPREYSRFQAGMKSICIEPKVGGRCTEVDPEGFQLDWGRVLEQRPPEQLTFTWQIGSDRFPQLNPEHSSKIDIVFKAISDSVTEILFEHRDIHRHDEGAQAYRDTLNFEYGWPFIWNKYLDSANT